MKKTVKVILCAVGLSALLIISGIAGMHIERNNQEALELQKQHVSNIAVVNMDDGIVVGDTQVNYASQLMSFPNENFTVTGLTDAKFGIENGLYAAYIVIPETFSASVTSIEHEPRKVLLEYQYNTRLDEEAELQAIKNINAFTNLLNSNIAYMYMDAILTEFHRVQDDSSTILANDNTERELLESVNAAQLIAIAEPVEEIMVSDNVKPVELAAYTSQNNVLMEALLLSYSEAAQQGKEEYVSIQETSTEVETAADNFLSTYDTVVEDTASRQSELLDEGQKALASAVDFCKQDITDQEKQINQMVEDIIDEQINWDQKEADRQLAELLAKYHKSYADFWESAYQAIKKEAEYGLHLQLKEGHGSSDPSVEDMVLDAYKRGLEDGLAVVNEDVETWEKNNNSEITLYDLKEIINYYRSPDKLLETDRCRNQRQELIKLTADFVSRIQLEWIDIEIPSPVLPEDDTEAPDNTENSGDAGTTEDSAGSGGAETTEVSMNGGSAGTIEDSTTDGNVATTEDNTEGSTETGGNGADQPEDEKNDSQIPLTKISETRRGEIADEIFEIFQTKAESEEIDNVLQTYFVDALSEENKNQIERLSDTVQQLERTMDDYEYSLMHYDPLRYLKNADLNTYLNDIEVNAVEMLGIVEQNNSEYQLYAAEMYTATSEHSTQLRSSLDEANARTSANVENCINDLIVSRETVNGQNVQMLKGFTDSLRYTRVGSQGNAEVYDYIVNPVVFRVNEQSDINTTAPILEQEKPIKVWLVIILGIGIIFCVTEIIINFRRQFKRQAEESEELF